MHARQRRISGRYRGTRAEGCPRVCVCERCTNKGEFTPWRKKPERRRSSRTRAGDQVVVHSFRFSTSATPDWLLLLCFPPRCEFSLRIAYETSHNTHGGEKERLRKNISAIRRRRISPGGGEGGNSKIRTREIRECLRMRINA